MLWTTALKMALWNFIPGCNAFELGLLNESVGIRLWNAMRSEKVPCRHLQGNHVLGCESFDINSLPNISRETDNIILKRKNLNSMLQT